ncbi:MAG: twitch domain-containing radical SAM protein [Bacteroidales bacterium]|nr:twitch domain-containing radical SAM protein [Bacteroidales bacterium]
MKSITKKNIRTSFYPLWQQYNKFKAYLLRYPKSGNGFETVSQSKMIQYNKVRYHGAKRLFCYNPFVNIFFNINGDAIACCRSHQTVLGKYPEQSIKEIWFGKRFEKMREHMLHNDLNMGCNYCKLQIESNRFHSLPSMHPEEFASTKPGAYPQTMELELSNNCNLQCVMCSGRVSSAIRQNRDKLPPLKLPYDDSFVEQLKEFLPHLKHISFYGGEPFLIDIYYKIWEQIIKINPDILIFVVTNGTIYNRRIEDLLKKAKFNFLVSIDSLNKEIFESIRVGANFENVMHNLQKFIELTNGQLAISHTPMKINWMETPEIVNYCNNKNLTLNLSYVEKPAKYALWSFQPHELEKVITFYDNSEIKTNHNSIISSYNIKVFNEWKEQVQFFKTKNSEIIAKYQNINAEFENYNIEFKQSLIKLFDTLPFDSMGIDSALKLANNIIENTKITPALIDGMKIVIKNMNNQSLLKLPNAQKFLTESDLFSGFIKKEISEDQFWARYY